MPYTTQMGLPWAPQSDTSRDAAVAADAFAATQEARVLAYIASRGSRGATMREAEHEMPIQRASACPRFAMLMAKGLIRKTDEKRDGCRAYVAVKP